VTPAAHLAAHLAARNAVALAFVLNGFCFASWVSRIPEVRATLGLSNSALGLLLLALAGGSVLALPTTGALIARLGTVVVVRTGVCCAAVGLVLAALSLPLGVAPVAVGLFVYGVGTGVWDVSMNVEGAAVEQGLGRSVMPRFHAGFSLGTVAGAVVGAAVVWAEVPAVWHLSAVAGAALAVVLPASDRFLPPLPEPSGQPAWHPWREPRTLAIGLMVLALALTEGTANDWLAVALVDGHGVAHWVGVAGFAAFVAAMTAGRMVGGGLLDRFGRQAVLWSTMAAAAVGVLLIVLTDHPVPVVAGILLWGAGASLGFPVGMSAAADDPVHAAARVSVVSTIGYGAFLAGPPLLGFVGDQVGTLDALLVVAGLLLPAALVVPATASRPGREVSSRARGRGT
jgi:fucose permease